MIHPLSVKNRITTVSLLALFLLLMSLCLSSRLRSQANGKAAHQSFYLAQVENDNDRNLSEQVRNSIKLDNSLSEASQEMSFSSKDGVITAKGIAKSEHDKARVFSAIRKIPGVFNINDQVQVKVTK